MSTEVAAQALRTMTTADLKAEIASVEIRGLSKRYPARKSWSEIARHPRHRREVTVVKDVSFEVKRGEFFGLLGPNGAGKTTLFKMLSTLILPNAGTASIVGFDLRTQPEGVRSVLSPVIADERSLNWRLSALENLRFYAALYGLRGAERERRVSGLLDLVGLEGAGHKIVGAFSSGMKQRLLLARALLSNPKVLLLDEPTRSLDPLAARSFRHFLKEEIAGKQGCTVLVATHNSEEAFDLCDRVGVLDQGRMIAVGTPDELIRLTIGIKYQVWTPDPNHSAFFELESSDAIFNVRRFRNSMNAEMVEFNLLDGDHQPEEVLRRLVQSGVRVSQFERVHATLAEIIEETVRSNRES